ncbi:MAG: phosphomethylpyrimidine synthase ThiC [Methanomicrobiales archaeon]|nr:phosphomethylpyrimidine synthase ThiC [Methanomicrobiales archaeon]
MCVMHSLLKECQTGIPKAIRQCAKEEGLAPERLFRAVVLGRVTIPANPLRRHRTCAIGEGCRVKVNVNVGTSAERCNPDLEVEKAKAALDNGADTLMDLSSAGDIPETRRRILAMDAPVGTVPIYEAVRRAGSAADLDTDLLFRVIREHCTDGVDFLTLHCGVNLEAVEVLKSDPRILPVVSRGGAFHVAWMLASGEENPLYAEFDYLLEILDEHEVVISLGDGMRPGSVCDAERMAKTTEYLTLGKLSKRAFSYGIQRFIEGPGHIPFDQVGHNVRMIKELTDGAPLYLLGPLVTDRAPGYDHIVGAIGGAIACLHGADFLCMVSPSEHLALPRTEEIVEGTRAAKIAAYIGDTVRRGHEWQMGQETGMAEARRDLDWERQFGEAIYGGHAREIHERDGVLETCSMCGELCAIRIIRESFGIKKTDRERGAGRD